MKKRLDKFRSMIIINKRLYLFLIIILFIGLISGSLFTIFLNKDDKVIVMANLNGFFDNINQGSLNYLDCLKNSFLNNLFYIALIWILGLSVIGIFFSVPVLYFKSFIVGFSISSILVNYGLKGVFIAIFYSFPHLIMNLFLILIISLYTIVLSSKIFKSFLSKKTVDFRFIFNKYMLVLIIGIVAIMITSLYETFIVPAILQVLL